MRWFAFICLLAVAGRGQEKQTRTYVYELNGRKVDWVGPPREQVVEKILREEGGTKVVERITKRFDQDGRRLPGERTVTETVTRPDGGKTERVAVWRGDLNGRMELAERVTSETSRAGPALTTETRIERPSPGGGLALAERRETRATASGDVTAIDELLLRPDANGRLSPAARRVVKQIKSGSQTEERVDEYEAVVTGALQLSRQTVSQAARSEDGSERRVVDVFGLAAPGRTISGREGPQLRERQFYTTKAGADGSIVETFSIQRPSLANSKELGPVVKISETVCTGKCKE